MLLLFHFNETHDDDDDGGGGGGSKRRMDAIYWEREREEKNEIGSGGGLKIMPLRHY